MARGNTSSSTSSDSIPAADRLSPHSQHQSFATGLLGSGTPLQDVMGHADPRTTRACDRSRKRVDGRATYAMEAWLRRSSPSVGHRKFVM